MHSEVVEVTVPEHTNGFRLDRKKRGQADPSDWRKGCFTSASLGHQRLDDSFARPTRGWLSTREKD